MERRLETQAREVLSATGWLSRQTSAFQDELFARGVAQGHPAGGCLYRVGDHPGGIYGLVSGDVGAAFGMGELSPRLISYGRPGRWAGANSYFSGGPRVSELRAITDCVVLRLPLPAMQAMAERDPLAMRAFGQIVVENLEAVFEILRVFALRTSEQRVAAALLRASLQGSATIGVTHEMLSPLANASVRQVAAATGKLARAGAIRQGYRSIEILDHAALVRAATKGRAEAGRRGKARWDTDKDP